MKKIYIWDEKIIKFQINACKEIAKIGKMCSDTIQKEFYLIKTLNKWTFKDLWDYSKT